MREPTRLPTSRLRASSLIPFMTSDHDDAVDVEVQQGDVLQAVDEGPGVVVEDVPEAEADEPVAVTVEPPADDLAGLGPFEAERLIDLVQEQESVLAEPVIGPLLLRPEEEQVVLRGLYPVRAGLVEEPGIWRRVRSAHIDVAGEGDLTVLAHDLVESPHG